MRTSYLDRRATSRMQALEAPGHQNAHKLLDAKVEEVPGP